MTDHLEAYRRMARISRFVPSPLARLALPRQRRSPHLSDSEAARSAEWVNSAPRILASDPTTPMISPSEHIENLVQTAVKKVTVLPSSYIIQENIGDRISRLSTRSTPPILLSPKIPQPDPNWIPPVVEVPESVQVTATSEPIQEEIAKDSDSIQEEIAEDSDSIQEEIAKDSDSIQEEVAEDSESAQEDVAGNSESVQGDSIETKQIEETPAETTIAAAKSLIEKTIESVKKSLFPAVEEVEIAPNSTQESETTIQVSCPKCSSQDLRKNGHRGDKQKYICQDCGEQFVAAMVIEERPKKVEKPAAKTDVSKAAKPSSKKGQSKGFGSRSR